MSIKKRTGYHGLKKSFWESFYTNPVIRTPISYPWFLIRIKTVINFENLSVKTVLLKERVPENQ